MSEGKKPGSMSDDERALIGRELRQRALTPAQGVPVASDDDDFTPIGHIVASIEQRVGELSYRERLIVQAFGQHTANIEMRSRKRSDSQDTSILRKELDAVQLAIVDIRGESGDNGKLGELRRRVDKAEARKWWAITFLAGLLVTVIGSAIAFGSWMGSIETDVETLKRRSNASAKDTTP